jgi:hypothetical protein
VKVLSSAEFCEANLHGGCLVVWLENLWQTFADEGNALDIMQDGERVEKI